MWKLLIRVWYPVLSHVPNHFRSSLTSSNHIKHKILRQMTNLGKLSSRMSKQLPSSGIALGD